MEWQKKAAALNALKEISIKMRGVGDWYVQQNIEIGGNGLLRGAYGNGKTPAEAIENHWMILVEEVPIGFYLVINATSDSRRHVRWNGYMWEDLPLPAPPKDTDQ